jgi:hypothetical protein
MQRAFHSTIGMIAQFINLLTQFAQDICNLKV